MCIHASPNPTLHITLAALFSDTPASTQISVSVLVCKCKNLSSFILQELRHYLEYWNLRKRDILYWKTDMAFRILNTPSVDGHYAMIPDGVIGIFQ
jgi:hypothetical protein